MSAEDQRAELRQAERDLDILRGEMDAYVEIHRHMPEDVARDFAHRLEAVNARILRLRVDLHRVR